VSYDFFGMETLALQTVYFCHETRYWFSSVTARRVGNWATQTCTYVSSTPHEMFVEHITISFASNTLTLFHVFSFIYQYLGLFLRKLFSSHEWKRQTIFVFETLYYNIRILRILFFSLVCLFESIPNCFVHYLSFKRRVDTGLYVVKTES